MWQTSRYFHAEKVTQTYRRKIELTRNRKQNAKDDARNEITKNERKKYMIRRHIATWTGLIAEYFRLGENNFQRMFWQWVVRWLISTFSTFPDHAPFNGLFRPINIQQLSSQTSIGDMDSFRYRTHALVQARFALQTSEFRVR